MSGERIVQEWTFTDNYVQDIGEGRDEFVEVAAHAREAFWIMLPKKLPLGIGSGQPVAGEVAEVKDGGCGPLRSELEW
jgi:hypothetical protein